MLKNISNLGKSLNKAEQQTIIGGRAIPAVTTLQGGSDSECNQDSSEGDDC